MRQFCFVCGRSEKLKEGFCSKCYKEKTIFPKNIEVTMCNKCKLMKFENKWTVYNLEKVVSKKLKTKEKIIIEEKHKSLLVNLKGKSIEIKFHKNKVICTLCSKKSSGYYEGVIQLRGFSETDLEKIKDVFSGMKTFYHLKIVKGGIDIKLGNKLVINNIAKSIRKKIPCEQKKSSKIVTRVDGRDVYRSFVLLRKI